MEILDSAQENFPHLWVNGEKYVFSEDVISAGDRLYKHFLALREITADTANDILAGFEASWVQYE